MAYSMDLRKRVLALYDQGLQTKDIALRLQVSRAWARRVKQRRGQPPRTVGGSQPKLNAAAQATLLQWVQEQPDATLAELQGRIAKELKITLSIGCLWNTLRRLKLSFKKSPSKPASSFGRM